MGTMVSVWQERLGAKTVGTHDQAKLLLVAVIPDGGKHHGAQHESQLVKVVIDRKYSGAQQQNVRGDLEISPCVIRAGMQI